MRKRNAISQELAEKIANYDLTGWSQYEIAMMLKISRHVVSRELNNISPKPESFELPSSLTLAEKIKFYRSKKISWLNISKHLKIGIRKAMSLYRGPMKYRSRPAPAIVMPTMKQITDEEAREAARVSALLAEDIKNRVYIRRAIGGIKPLTSIDWARGRINIIADNEQGAAHRARREAAEASNWQVIK
jgi:hypothetical protein